MGLEKPIQYLKGVGKKRAELFSKKGIKTVGDLLYFFPRAHEDRSVIKPIDKCVEGETVCICASVYQEPQDRYVRRNMLITSMLVFDNSGMMNSRIVNWDNENKLADLNGNFCVLGNSLVKIEVRIRIKLLT